MNDDDLPGLGPCCICEQADGVRNIVMLNRRNAVPGHGWGCFQCGLPCDGASAVLCDGCLIRYQEKPEALKHACRGYPAEDGRILISELPPGEFDHDLSKHPEQEQ